LENVQGKPAEYDAVRPFQPTHLGHICEVIKIAIERSIWDHALPVAAPEFKTKYELARDILSPFGIEVGAIGGGIVTPGKKLQEMSELKELHLPLYIYDRVIERTVEEIRNN